MKCKVTALANVRLFVSIGRGQPLLVGGRIESKPYETREWVSLSSGDQMDGLGLIWGIDPQFAPGHIPTPIPGVGDLVPLPPDYCDILPRDFFGLIRVEAGTDDSHR